MINSLIKSINFKPDLVNALLPVLKDTYEKLKGIYTEMGLIEQWTELDKEAREKCLLGEETP